MNSGIYKIENKINGKVYIGQSINVHKRMHNHLKRLKKNNHGNNKLQNDFTLYGEDSFTFNILERCNKEVLNVLESFYINKYKSIFKGYNISNSPNNKDNFEHIKNELCNEEVLSTQIIKIKADDKFISLLNIFKMLKTSMECKNVKCNDNILSMIFNACDEIGEDYEKYNSYEEAISREIISNIFKQPVFNGYEMCTRYEETIGIPDGIDSEYDLSDFVIGVDYLSPWSIDEKNINSILKIGEDIDEVLVAGIFFKNTYTKEYYYRRYFICVTC